MTRQASTRTASRAERRWPDTVIEAAWLAGLALLPLVFSAKRWLVFYSEPKDAVLHLVAVVIVAAWAFDMAFSRRGPRAAGDAWSYRRVTAWAGRRPGRWAVLAALGFAVAAVLSTLASPLPLVSLWGRDFNDLGNELYSQLALLVIFFAIALRLRRIDQARRVLYVIAGAGAVTAVYGISQHFGWDPIGPGAGAGRVYASFGNPIFFGSYLVMSAAVTLSLAMVPAQGRPRLWLPGLAVLLGLQMAALWFAGSRGPWLGFLVSSMAFGVAGWAWLDRRRLLVRAGPVFAGGLAAAVLLAMPPGAATGGTRDVSAVGYAVREAGSLGSASTAISGSRGAIWRGAARLARTWDREPEDAPAQHLLRPVLGFGPEMYYYSYPLSVDIEPLNEVASHAHNYPLQVFLELGLVGLLAFLAFALSLLWAAVRLLRAGARGGPAAGLPVILAAGILAALAGRAVEQMVGVARVADLAAFWALAGLVVALGEIASRPALAAGAPPPPRRRRPRRRPGPARPAAALPLVAAAAVGVAAIAVFFARDLETLRAGRLAARGYERIQAGQGNRALELFQRAAGLAPDVERYHLEVSWLLRNAGLQAPDPETARKAYRAAYDAAAVYEGRDPYAYATQKRLAAVLVDRSAAGEPGLLDEIAARYMRLAAMLPSYPGELALAANGLVAARQFELGIAVADRAIALEARSEPVPQAWWARGEALMRLDRSDEAEASFETAIERAPESKFAANSHRSLAALYDSRGLPDQAEAHRARAAEIDLALAAAG